MTRQTLGGSLETTRFHKTYGENADLSRETRHWNWTKVLIKVEAGSPEPVSMVLDYWTSPVLPNVHSGLVGEQAGRVAGGQLTVTSRVSTRPPSSLSVLKQ